MSKLRHVQRSQRVGGIVGTVKSDPEKKRKPERLLEPRSAESAGLVPGDGKAAGKVRLYLEV